MPHERPPPADRQEQSSMEPEPRQLMTHAAMLGKQIVRVTLNVDQNELRIYCDDFTSYILIVAQMERGYPILALDEHDDPDPL